MELVKNTHTTATTGTAASVMDRSRDRALLGRLAARDEQALETLFDLHAAALRSRMSRILGSEAEAEEIVQDTFLQVWQQADRYCASRASARGWLMVVARSRALDRLRSRQARSRREELHMTDDARRAIAPRAQRDLEAAERARGLARALEVLPAKQRQCIELAYFQGLSQRQIAARLSEPLGTVKSRVLLGVRKLRETLRAA